MGKKRKNREEKDEPEGERDTSTRLKKKAYEKELKALNMELVKMQ